MGGLTKEPFQVERACIRQLVWYCSKGSKSILETNIPQALFLGWRIDAGMRYRNVVRILDYYEFRTTRNTAGHDVKEPEFYIEDGPPIFPFANATKRFGRRLNFGCRLWRLPDIPILREVTSASESIGPLPLRRLGARGVCSIADRIVKFGETPRYLTRRQA